MTGRVRQGLAALCIAAALWIVGASLGGLAADVLTFAAVIAGVLALLAIAVGLVRD